MHTKRTESELTIQETPGCLWFIGIFFATVGAIFVYGAIGGFNNWSDASLFQIAVTFLIGASGIGVGWMIIKKAPISKLVIDRIDDKIYLTRRLFFDITEEVYDFSDVEQFCLIEDIDDEGLPIWYFGMDLVDGETIQINSMASHSEDYQLKFVFESNDFSRKSLPLFQIDLELEN